MKIVNSKQYIVDRQRIKFFLFAFLLFTVYSLLSATTTLAQTDYQLLTPLPQVETTEGKTTAKAYIEGAFVLLIGVAGVLAVVKIIYGGIQYMSTDAFQGKSDAKDTIRNAIWGLLLAIGAWMILNTISPNLVNFNFTLEPVVTAPSGAAAVGGPGLTQEQVRDQLKLADIGVVDGIKLSGIQQSTIDEAVRLKQECGCEVVVTSATGGVHEAGVCSHSNGYKIDLRTTSSLSNHIKKYPYIGVRSDGAGMYRAPNGAVYALESNHWDVAVC